MPRICTERHEGTLSEYQTFDICSACNFTGIPNLVGSADQVAVDQPHNDYGKYPTSCDNCGEPLHSDDN